MSPAKSQKYFDKCAEEMNKLDVDAARAKLIKLHTKVIGSDAKYVPDAADDFPAAASDFKEKFGMSRIKFWKMNHNVQLLQLLLACTQYRAQAQMTLHLQICARTSKKQQRRTKKMVQCFCVSSQTKITCWKLTNTLGSKMQLTKHHMESTLI